MNGIAILGRIPDSLLFTTILGWPEVAINCLDRIHGTSLLSLYRHGVSWFLIYDMVYVNRPVPWIWGRTLYEHFVTKSYLKNIFTHATYGVVLFYRGNWQDDDPNWWWNSGTWTNVHDFHVMVEDYSIIQYIQQFWIPDTLESREYCGHFCFKSLISWASWIHNIVSTDLLNQPPGAQTSTNKLEYQPPRQQ